MAHRYRYRKAHAWLAALLFIAGLLLGAQKAGLIGNAAQTPPEISPASTPSAASWTATP
jgi:hypothetical protein